MKMLAWQESHDKVARVETFILLEAVAGICDGIIGKEAMMGWTVEEADELAQVVPPTLTQLTRATWDAWLHCYTVTWQERVGIIIALLYIENQ